MRIPESYTRPGHARMAALIVTANPEMALPVILKKNMTGLIFFQKIWVKTFLL